MKQGLYWFGALCLAASAWTLPEPRGYVMAVVGLLVLTIQAVENRVWTFVAINVLSVVGYTLTLAKVLA